MKLSLLVSFTVCLLLAGAGTPQQEDKRAVSSRSAPEFLCPVATVECPDSVRPGSPIKFSAKVLGAGPSPSLTLDWSMSAGTILSGQKQTHISTPDSITDITVDTTELLGDSTVTAAVEVSGLPRSCDVRSSCTTALLQPLPMEHYDEYGNIKFEYEQARLDTYSIALLNDPTMTGYIVCYGGRKGRRGEAMARCERAKKYLVSRRGFDPNRINLIDGGFMEDLTVVLWIMPPDMKPPVNPTVSPSEVQFINAPQKQKKRAARNRRSGV